MSASDSLASILERTRQNLLDLSLRNRLINTPRGAARSKRLDIVDEISDEVFRTLVVEGRSMSFLAGAENQNFDEKPSNALNESTTSLIQPEEDLNGGLAARRSDKWLQTGLTSSKLQERLLSLYFDARTFEEEQGVSILYLALGFLEWYEADSSNTPRFAPLILIPVDLTRASASSRFKLAFRDDDLETNLSLQAKLRQEFGLELAEVGHIDGLVPTNYFAQVESAIHEQHRWKIHANEMTLCFFSFAKYLMYRDLDPATWPSHSPLIDNSSLRQLLVDGFQTALPVCDEQAQVDSVILPQHMIHVTDADSSQAIVIEEVRCGRSLVVQGPPGTGKSQTITNLIATAVHAGKKVLFVAEKMAALDVVKSRLDRLGLGTVCLELHSHKSKKKATLAELNRTLELRRPRVSGRAESLQRLVDVREQLNRHVDLMNKPRDRSDVSVFQILGHLVGCHADGVISTAFELNGPTDWTRAEFEERSRQLTELQSYVAQLGDVTAHPFRGIRRTTPILPSDIQTLIATIRKQATRLDDLSEMTVQLCQELQQLVPESFTLKSIVRLTDLGRHCSHRPTMDRKAIVDSVWEIHPGKIRYLVEQGLLLNKFRRKLDGVVAEVAWKTELATARKSLASHGRCWCWFLYPDYWRSIAFLRGILKRDLPPKLNQQLELIDDLTSAQSALKEIQKLADSIGRPAFGSMWNDDASDFEALQVIVEWEQKGREALFTVPFRSISANLSESSPAKDFVTKLTNQIEVIESEWQAMRRSLDLDLQVAFSVDEDRDVPLPELINRFNVWEANSESLSKWVGYRVRHMGLEQLGLGSLLAEFERGSFDAGQLVDRFRHAYYESLLKDILAKEPDLAAFDGSSHEQRIRDFQALDVARMDVARSEVALAHFSGIPHESSLGEMAIIRGEIAKKRMHRPIRQLLRDAGTAVQAIKPVFMMSPLSVAQFLEPGALDFDLLVMDEASQVTPEDAIGAVARAKQIVVVGDSRQLPPSRFFSKLLDEGDADEDSDLVNTSNLESVLGLCVARGLPQRMLRWHYRSRHHSLIAVSNQEFYDNQLCVIPSPTCVGDGMGLQFHFLPDGRFDRGGTATNRCEASTIADAVIAHAQLRPTKSLGVAAFSVAQRDAIRDELELRLRMNPALDEFFATGRHENFFVKNLENVQGDERDFIFISVGYAPDSTGNLTMNFGPLGTEGGERRLNVLISRAKECCVVFSSIKADQINLDRARSRGAAALKTFLKFAETGRLEESQHLHEAGDSDFEKQVTIALEHSGLTVHPKVGTTGMSVDLAIVDPDDDSRYVLGIECDGESYQASRWARDRDRLQETVLSDRGWKLHRIWSIDWFHRPGELLNRVLTAVEQARSIAEQHSKEAVDSGLLASQTMTRKTTDEIEREEIHDAVETTKPLIVPYVESDFPVASTTPILDLDVRVLREIVVKIVSIERPVHRSEVTRRILSLWKLQRLGPAIARKIDSAIDACVEASELLQDQEQFLEVPGQEEVSVRSREKVKSLGLRNPELIPASEIRAAILELVTQHVGITRDELFASVAKRLGLKLVTPRLRIVLIRRLELLVQQRELTDRGPKLFASEP